MYVLRGNFGLYLFIYSSIFAILHKFWFLFIMAYLYMEAAIW